MLSLEYSPAALEKLGAIHRYIAGELQNQSGANSTIMMIRDKIRLLKTMPEVGSRLMNRCEIVPDRYLDARVLLCGDYLTIYVYDSDMVRILQIYHQSQDYVRHLFRGEDA
jgi:plasmid stabilization system protein ParE